MSSNCLASEIPKQPDSRQGVQPLFEMGFIGVTPGVRDHLIGHGVTATLELERHVSGDWGNVPHYQARENFLAVKHGEQIISVYDIAGRRVWIITEGDRSATMLLFPEEY
jgi:hypothetical protein